MPADGRHRLNSEVVKAKVIDGEAIVINLVLGRYYSLEGAAGTAWMLLSGGATAEETGAALAERFEIDPSVAAADAGRLLDDLVAEDLVLADATAIRPPAIDPAGERSRAVRRAAARHVPRHGGSARVRSAAAGDRRLGVGALRVLRARAPSAETAALARACLPNGAEGREAYAGLAATGDPLAALRRGEVLRAGLLPLLLHATEANGVTVDPAVRSVLRAARVHEELRVEATAAAVADTLRQASEPAVVLPGIAFAATAYPAWELRHTHDLDLLVAAGAGAAVHQSGFPVARHTALFAPGLRRVGRPDVADRCRAVDVAGVPALVLDPVDALVHTCVHGLTAGHAGSPLWAIDAWFLVGSEPDLDWAAVAHRALEWDVALPARAALEWLARELRMAVPAEVLAGLRRAGRRIRPGRLPGLRRLPAASARP